jgi:superfamily II DNA or RNA helicase
MSAKLALRDYQEETISALFTAWSEGMRQPAVVLPTGAGKTVIFAALIERFMAKQRGPLDALKVVPDLGSRVIVLVHRDELADQAIAKIRSAAPHLSVGKVKAEDDDTHADVMVCSVQTVSRERRLNRLAWHETKHGAVGLIITDECHHAAARSYQDIYSAFPDALHAGFTATLERGDGVGLGSVWNDVVYSRSPLWMMKHGYLVQPRAFREDVAGLDLKSVKRSGGDYQAADLGRMLGECDVAASLPAVWKEHAVDRPTIVFTPTVATAHSVADSFMIDHGVPSAVVSGETPREDRIKIFDDFRTGRIKILSNCMVLTEGFDAPWASCAIIARPTQSRPLYVQMVGRVLRPWHGKTDAIVINVAGAGGKISTLVDLDPGAIEEIKDGETPLEAEEREAAEAQELTETVRRTVIKLREVSSLFEASHRAWQETAGGVMFISAGEWTYFLWPNRDQPGSWDVCRKPKYGKWERTAHTALDVEMAMSWAEAEAEDHGSFSVSRSALWRRGKPTEKQLEYARGLGIPVDSQTLGKAELSDAISYVLESRALDPYIGVV